MIVARFPARPFVRAVLALVLWLGIALPASAAVTITFWSHEFGNNFPHAFITMRGHPDRGGAPVDMNIGFTARHVSPAILFGSVAGMLEPADINYMKGSDAHFSVAMTDDQYLAVLKLLDEWGPGGNQRYDMNKRNCVTFVKIAAERLGLAGTDQPGLMKRPRSYLVAVEAANAGRVATVDLHGKQYIAGLTPIPGLDPELPVLTATGAIAPALAFTDTHPAAAPTAVITAKSMETGRQGRADTAAEPAAGGTVAGLPEHIETAPTN
ncbi:hypothetical protein [Sphingomonas bacterium]|uniref:hypothetical protein n=1 Tax=Sphingomonas bacterium TaxID=1895847 RepID=UPI0015769A04|nr:hypothetical protein [Sphingomonas bacterium]